MPPFLFPWRVGLFLFPRGLLLPLGARFFSSFRGVFCPRGSCYLPGVSHPLVVHRLLDVYPLVLLQPQVATRISRGMHSHSGEIPKFFGVCTRARVRFTRFFWSMHPRSGEIFAFFGQAPPSLVAAVRNLPYISLNFYFTVLLCGWAGKYPPCPNFAV